MKLLLSRVVIPFARTGNLTGLSHSNKPPGFAYTLTYITEKCRGYLLPLSGRYPLPPSNKCKTPHIPELSHITPSNEFYSILHTKTVKKPHFPRFAKFIADNLSSTWVHYLTYIYIWLEKVWFISGLPIPSF